MVWLAFLLPTATLWACQVPVFRYALERWPADVYDAVIYTEDGSEAAVPDLEQTATRFGNVRWTVRSRADAALLPEPDVVKAAIAGSREPYLVIAHPRDGDGRVVAWHGPFRGDLIAQAGMSPARRIIADRLFDGVSVVWILLESGDKQRDEAAREHLDQAVGRAARELQLPEGVLPADAAATPPGPIDLDDTNDIDRLRSEIPLTLSFDVVAVPRDAPEEQIFVASLMTVEEDLVEYADQPLAFPVFGRGRTLYALAGRGITDRNVFEACRYLVGACSCVVKDENPGVDLPFEVDWDGAVHEGLVVDKVLPPLSGPGALIADDDVDADPPLGEALPASNVLSERTDSRPPPAPERRGIVRMTLFATLGLLALCIVAGTMLLRRK